MFLRKRRRNKRRKVIALFSSIYDFIVLLTVLASFLSSRLALWLKSYYLFLQYMLFSNIVSGFSWYHKVLHMTSLSLNFQNGFLFF